MDELSLILVSCAVHESGYSSPKIGTQLLKLGIQYRTSRMKTTAPAMMIKVQTNSAYKHLQLTLHLLGYLPTPITTYPRHNTHQTKPYP